MRRPLFYPLMALMAGILTGDCIVLDYSVLGWTSLGILLFLLLCLRKKWIFALWACILSFIFVAGLFSASRYHYFSSNPYHILHQAGQGKITIEGVVISEEQLQDKSLLLVDCVRLKTDSDYFKLSGYLRLAVPAGISFDRGDFIRFRTSVKPVSGFHNPGGFDYQRYLNRQGIFVSGFIAGAQDIILIRRHWIKSVPASVDHFRQRLKRLIYTFAPSPEREILEAMTIGNQKSIPPDIQDAFAQTGTSHILSISGLHVGLVASAGFLLMLWLLKLSEYLMLRFNIIKIAAAVSFIPVAIYTLVAGMETPVLRSAFMVFSFLMALLIGKPRDLFNILFAAAFIILIILPSSLFEISFQLSFSAVLALIYIVPKFDKLSFDFISSAPNRIQTFFKHFYLFVLVSLAATLGTLPLIIYYFNRLSTITLLANLVLVPLLGMLTLFFVLLFIFFAMFSPLAAGWMIKVASFFTSISVVIIKRLASLPWASISFIKPGVMEIVLLYLILFCAIETLTPSDRKDEKRFIGRHPALLKFLLFASLALLTVNGIYLYWKDRSSTELRLTAIDVGQGSSTLIEFPKGVRMLIDGGGFRNSSFDMGKSVVAPFLYYKRIRKIDIVVLTHPHPDHLQGLPFIIDHFDVGEVWTTAVKANDDLYRLWEKTLKERGTRIRYITNETPPEILAGAKVEFLWPDPQSVEDPSLDANNRSLVLKIIFGDTRFLLTGDITSRIESTLIDSGKDLKSDLLLVPHHGSAYSSSQGFIGKVSPRFAIVSSGRYNVFGHPSPDVLNRYRANGVTLFRTDLHGAVTAFTNRKKIEITTRLK